MSAIGELLEEVVPWTVEEYLNSTDYNIDSNYVPSTFALLFVTFIKLVNGEEGESHLTPLVHYKMLDTLTHGGSRIINLCHRGIAKTTLMGEYLFLYLGTYGELPGFGTVRLALYVSDSMENGVKNMRKNLEYRYENSDFLKKWVPETKFTDTRWEFNNAEGKRFIVKGYGAKTGVRGALDAASKRELGILRRLAQGMVEIGRKIIAMNAVFLSEEEVVRITNEEFVTIRRDDLAGNYDLRLSISTAEEDNSKAQDLGFMLQTIGPGEDPGMRKIILSDICRLKKMPDLAKRIEDFQPQPDPMQQKMQQLEMARIEFEVAKIEAETARIRAETALKAQQVVTEEAKAENIRAETDTMNLDFVEQESGTKQARELEKQGEQARANMALEVVKAKVKPQPTTKKK